MTTNVSCITTIYVHNLYIISTKSNRKIHTQPAVFINISSLLGQTCSLNELDINIMMGETKYLSSLVCEILVLISYGPRREKTRLRGFANNKGADQPAHPRSLISVFVIHLLEIVISRLATCKILSF